jgi:hypothetical protein
MQCQREGEVRGSPRIGPWDDRVGYGTASGIPFGESVFCDRRPEKAGNLTSSTASMHMGPRSVSSLLLEP